jgi:hypothetical protein
MPIANCYLNKITVSEQQLEALTTDWSEAIGVDLSDICLSLIEVSAARTISPS